jgi:hypothetical protein
MSGHSTFRQGLLTIARALYVLVTVAVVLLAISSLGIGGH